jgi:Cu-Zn family superoxide dismutase
MIFFLLSSADTLMKAKAYIVGFKEKIVGEVWFYQLSDMRVVLKGRVEGLGKEKTYAIHIHEFGDCSSPSASDGHFNPYFSGKHGNPNDPIGTHHSGDLPNITTDKNGVAKIPSPYSILGRSVIIHMQHDDYMSQPAGNAGDRIACGIIWVVK